MACKRENRVPETLNAKLRISSFEVRDTLNPKPLQETAGLGNKASQRHPSAHSLAMLLCSRFDLGVKVWYVIVNPKPQPGPEPFRVQAQGSSQIIESLTGPS